MHPSGLCDHLHRHSPVVIAQCKYAHLQRREFQGNLWDEAEIGGNHNSFVEHPLTAKGWLLATRPEWQKKQAIQN